MGEPMNLAMARIWSRHSQLGPWYLYVGVILAAWSAFVFGFGLLSSVLRQWPMALVMILGSLVAGSTPMGGGAVSFPFLVLWFGAAPDDARNFALMIQAVGMTSAMIFILCRGVPVPRKVLLWTCGGGMAGMLVGSVFVATYVPGNYVKLVFACMWMSFGLLTIAKERDFRSFAGSGDMSHRSAMRVGLLAGVIGGMVASVIGVGVEMILYTTLVLLYRCDLKIAVPTSVSAMAVTSVIGVLAQIGAGHISRDITMKFLAACPLVIFGAPVGTYIVSAIPRPRTLYAISCLCALQFVWILVRLQRTRAEWIFLTSALSLAAAAFHWMYRRGQCQFARTLAKS